LILATRCSSLLWTLASLLFLSTMAPSSRSHSESTLFLFFLYSLHLPELEEGPWVLEASDSEVSCTRGEQRSGKVGRVVGKEGIIVIVEKDVMEEGMEEGRVWRGARVEGEGAGEGRRIRSGMGGGRLGSLLEVEPLGGPREAPGECTMNSPIVSMVSRASRSSRLEELPLDPALRGSRLEELPLDPALRGSSWPGAREGLGIMEGGRRGPGVTTESLGVTPWSPEFIGSPDETGSPGDLFVSP